MQEAAAAALADLCARARCSGWGNGQMKLATDGQHGHAGGRWVRAACTGCVRVSMHSVRACMQVWWSCGACLHGGVRPCDADPVLTAGGQAAALHHGVWPMHVRGITHHNAKTSPPLTHAFHQTGVITRTTARSEENCESQTRKRETRISSMFGCRRAPLVGRQRPRQRPRQRTSGR